MTTLHPKTMKNEGFKPPIYGLEALKMKVMVPQTDQKADRTPE